MVEETSKTSTISDFYYLRPLLSLTSTREEIEKTNTTYYRATVAKKIQICFLADIGHRSRQQPVARVREDELRRRERHRVGEGIQTLDHLSGFKNHPSRLGNNCVS